MPAWSDISMVAGENISLTVPLTPPVPIGSWEMRFQVNENFPLAPWQSGLIVKSMAPGFYKVSGMTIVNSGQGIFLVSLSSSDTSGFAAGNYAYAINRINSANVTCITQGFLQINDN